MDNPDKHCVTRPDGECTSTDPRCMHQGRVVMDSKQELVDYIARLKAPVTDAEWSEIKKYLRTDNQTNFEMAMDALIELRTR